MPFRLCEQKDQLPSFVNEVRCLFAGVSLFQLQLSCAGSCTGISLQRLFLCQAGTSSRQEWLVWIFNKGICGTDPCMWASKIFSTSINVSSTYTNKLIVLCIDKPISCGKKHVAWFPWTELSHVSFCFGFFTVTAKGGFL